MKIGLVIPHNEIGTDPGAMRALVQAAEDLGAEQLLLYDHVLGADPNRPGGWKGPYDQDIQFHEPLTTFAFIAAVTSRIYLMPAVLILPQRQTVLVAKQSAEVAILSNNRLRLGIGTGWNQVEYEGLNENFNTRGRRQSEQVEVMRRLWKEESIDYQGKYHHINLASINPRPSVAVPIWFGGGAPPLIDRCARLGDGWIPLMKPDANAAACIAQLKEKRLALGFAWEGFGIQAQAQYAGGNPERWHKHAQKWQDLGATHLAIATHNAGLASVPDHIKALETYLAAVADVSKS